MEPCVSSSHAKEIGYVYYERAAIDTVMILFCLTTLMAGKCQWEGSRAYRGSLNLENRLIRVS